MPTYEYKCTHCGYYFEVSQKMSDKPLDKCPKCHKAVRRLISSGVGLIFKGSGFYATDYKKKPISSQDSAKDNICPKMKEGCDGCKNQAF